MRRLLIVLLILLAACQPVVIQPPVTVEPIIITATFEATPTQEVATVEPTPRPSWDVSCIREPGAIPITERPCPVDTLDPMEFAAYPSMNYPDYSPTITCDNGCPSFPKSIDCFW